MENIFEIAIKEIYDKKQLSLPTRKKIWLSYGEVDANIDYLPPPITKSLKNRVVLASLCVKKVIGEWEKYQSDDKRPQFIMEKINDYLENRAILEEINKLAKDFQDDILIAISNNPDNFVYNVGLAVCYAAGILFNDDPLLFEDENPECRDEELDFDMWDASYHSYLAYTNTYEICDNNTRKMKGLEFWIWYVTEAARLAEIEITGIMPDIEKKSIINEEAEVTLENFAKALNRDFDYDSLEFKDGVARIKVLQCANGARCDKCNVFSARQKGAYNAVMELGSLKDRKIKLIIRNSMFYCDNDNCNHKCFAASSLTMTEIKDNYREFISGPERVNRLCEIILTLYNQDKA